MTCSAGVQPHQSISPDVADPPSEGPWSTAAQPPTATDKATAADRAAARRRRLGPVIIDIISPLVFALQIEGGHLLVPRPGTNRVSRWWRLPRLARIQLTRWRVRPSTPQPDAIA